MTSARPCRGHLFVIAAPSGTGKTSLVRALLQREPALGFSCIRCGACLNICPVYNNVGGYAYGYPISGPTGVIFASQILGTKLAGTLPFASTLCGACNDICPVKIPITRILLHLRRRVAEGDESEPATAPVSLRMGARAGALALGSTALY